MKKLFKAIRHYELDTVKEIIEKNPKTLFCTATPPPKKDIGQSPLQVAIKISAFDIAYYLIDKGADINFMEEEAEGTALRMPVIQDAIRNTMHSLCYKNTKSSDDGLKLVQYMLEKGADVNKCSSIGYNALDECVSCAKLLLEGSTYENMHKKAEEQFVKLLDLLIANGADYKSWADRGHYPEPEPGPSNRSLFLDDFVPQPDTESEFKMRGRVHKFVIKGNEDRTANTRRIMQRYWKEHNLG